MDSHDLTLLAGDGLGKLYGMGYPGRFLGIGCTGDGDGVVAYTIAGRSEGSQNRVFVKMPDGSIKTASADPDKDSGNIELTLYNAVRQVGKKIVVTNGKQTDFIAKGIAAGNDIFATMQDDSNELCCYEPDEPNFTPRISGVAEMVDGKLNGKIVICRKSFFGDAVVRNLFPIPECDPGFMLGISTYARNSKGPLPPYFGEPMVLPTGENAAAIIDRYWRVFSVNGFHVSLVVITFNDDGIIETLIENRHTMKV